MADNWRDRFEPRRNPIEPPHFTAELSPRTGYAPRAEPPLVDPFSGEGALSPRPQSAPPDDEALDLDPSVYRPWIVQRVRSRPPLMLHMRRYEPKSGLWTGWAVSYPHLIAIEYTGNRMLSLDFGTRRFMLEGGGLDELVRQLQDGAVMAVQEYTSALWPMQPTDPVVSAIRRLGADVAGL